MAEGESGVVWKDVLSENVGRIGYDEQSTELLVQWIPNGKTSAYGPGVPADIAEEVSKAWSVKGALNSQIIGKYPHRYVKSSHPHRRHKLV